MNCPICGCEHEPDRRRLRAIGWCDECHRVLTRRGRNLIVPPIWVKGWSIYGKARTEGGEPHRRNIAETVELFREYWQRAPHSTGVSQSYRCLGVRPQRRCVKERAEGAELVVAGMLRECDTPGRPWLVSISRCDCVERWGRSLVDRACELYPFEFCAFPDWNEGKTPEPATYALLYLQMRQCAPWRPLQSRHVSGFGSSRVRPLEAELAQYGQR
jgi:hypothetical protein